MISFKLGKEIEKGVFHLVTSVGQRENSESPWGIKCSPNNQSETDRSAGYCF